MVRSFEIKRFEGGSAHRLLDAVAIEEPLSIRVLHWRKDAKITESLAVTMRSPGADKELAAGLLLTEGVIANWGDVVDVRALGIEPSNEILVELAHYVDFDSWRQQRNGFVSSSCGVCGKASAEQIKQVIPKSAGGDWKVGPALINVLPRLLREHQAAFDQTGGLHAAALVSLDGKLEFFYEDIGRHNALDKVIGRALMDNRLQLNRQVVFMSSRSSFELIQKAAMAGFEVMASVGSPSSLAIETARSVGLTLICFVREDRFNIYSGDWRVDL